MRRLSLVALTALLSLPASAQRGQPFAEKGDVAIVAQVSGLEVLRLHPALGGVGVRYRFADRRVVAGSVALNAYDREQSGSFNAADEAGTRVDVTVWNENHFGRAGSRVSPFFGVGLGAGRAVYARETVADREESRTTTYRGGLFVGAEVRLVSRLTLGAAYVLGATYEDRTVESSPAGPAGLPAVDESRTLGVSTGITDLHLSVYF